MTWRPQRTDESKQRALASSIIHLRTVNSKEPRTVWYASCDLHDCGKTVFCQLHCASYLGISLFKNQKPEHNEIWLAGGGGGE